MNKKKNISKDLIISNYMEYVLDNNAIPKSIHYFSKKYNFKDEDFYKHFANFNRIEEEIFLLFFQNTLILIKNSEDYQSYSAKNQLLTFYFSFFELLTRNRSYILFFLEKEKSNLKKLKSLSLSKKEFTNFISRLDLSTLDLKQKSIEKLQQKTMQETAWIQLLFTIKYWIEDTSPSFEKTDIFIEKTINTSFDLLDANPVNSLIDLGKFLYKDLTHKV